MTNEITRIKRKLKILETENIEWVMIDVLSLFDREINNYTEEDNGNYLSWVTDLKNRYKKFLKKNEKNESKQLKFEL